MPSRRRDAKASTTSSPREERLKNRRRIAAAAAANNNKDDADDKIADDHHDVCDVKNNNNKDNVEEAVDENGLDENPYLVYRAGKIARNERRLRELGLPVPSHSSTDNVGVDDVEEVDSVDNDPLDEDYVDNDDNFEDDDDGEVNDEDDDNGGGKLPGNSSARLQPGSGLYYSDDDTKLDEVFNDEYRAKYFSSIPSEDVLARRRT